MGTFRDFKSSFPEESHAKGKAFEEFLVDWFFKNHPLYRHKFEKVWLWEDWPKPEGVAAQDLGTDLIARDTEGKIYAIQAKFYDVDSQIKFKDISTFLADSSKDYIDHRLLIGTAELAPNARKQLNSQEKSVSTFLLHDFEAWDFDWPTSLASLAKAKLKKPHEARPHQQAAIKDVCAKLDGRGQLIMACGTGKTLTGQRIAEELGSETTLVLLPSLLLLSGTMNEWLQQTKVGFHYLPVCSDASVGRKAAPETNFTSGELGNASTTDPKEIREFLEQKGNKVIFATYQSSGRVADALKGTRIKFDLILADEAHRCAGKVAADYGYVLDEKKLPASNRLFMTATPRIYKSNIKKAAKDADVEIASMDDEAVFGPVVHHLTFGQAIDQELLTDYQVVVVGVNDAAVDEMVQERTLVVTEAGLERDAATLGSQLGLMKAVRKYDLQRVITFHSRINQARDYAAEFQEVIDATRSAERPSGKITYSHVSGAMPTAERTNKLRALGLLEHEDRYLLGNARCLSEGVDVPALDGVAFVDPRRSEIDIIQAVGRAIRKSSNKTKGTIIIPVFIAEGEDPDEVLSSSAFDQVWKVVNALRAHDEKLGEELDQLRRAKGRGERVSIEDTKLIFDVHESVGDSFLQAFETKLVEATTESWEFWFGLLEKYYKENGNTLVPVGYSHDNQKLGIWVHRQRSIQKEISEDRRDRLNSLEFIWDVMSHWWLEAIEALKSYKEQNGDCIVPGHFVVGGFALGNWVGKQRAARLKGELAPEKVAELESLDFVWDVREHMWELGFRALEEYKNKNGDCLVPARHSRKADNFKLGTWVQTQRYTREKLSTDQIERLNDIGFVWDPLEVGWEKGIEAFRAFVAREGHSVVPACHREGDFNLGVWLGDQRKLFKKGLLSDEKQASLNQPGMVWNPLDKQWSDRYSLLKDFRKEHGHCNVPSAHRAKGVKLGLWVRNIRMKYDTLSEERIKQLNDIGFIWDLAGYSWERGHSALQEYKKKYGDCLVPSKYMSEDFALGYWVGDRRKDYKAGRLSRYQIDALERLGLAWSIHDSKWDSAFDLLRRYKTINGDCAVPNDFVMDGFTLGRWVVGQRAGKKQKRLSERRIELLDELGFIWDAMEYQWLVGFRLLTEFQKEHDHCRVPQNFTIEGFNLGSWVSVKRRQKRSGTLSPDRISALDKVGFSWDPKRW